MRSPPDALVLLLLLQLLSSSVRGCIHHQVLETTTSVTAPQTYGRLRGHRMLQDAPPNSLYKPLRLQTHFDNATISQLSSASQVFLTQFLVPAAVSFWSQALHVVPVVDGLAATRTCTGTSGAGCTSVQANQLCVDMPIPEAHFAPTPLCNASGVCSTILGETNTPIPNTDMLLYVRAATTTSCVSNVLAYAASCQRDQLDRPIFGMINFCPNFINPSQRAGPIFNQQLTTAMHEMAHALGFSASSYPLMRLPDGTPRTPRATGGRTGPTVPMPGVCNGATTRTTSSVFPSNSTIVYRTLRGRSVATMVTPAVARFAQHFFNCSTVPGADLENNDPACLGSHWEERLFSLESMSPVLNYNGNAFTALTLAFFEDTGWYQPNYTLATPLYTGMNQGCGYTTAPCLANGATVDSDVFCSSMTEACAPALLARSNCARANYTSALPSIYRYFPTITDGGTNMYADYCPLNAGYTNGDCSFASNLLKLPWSTIPALGEVYGTASRCALTTLRQSDMKGATVHGRFAGCYAMRCNASTTPPTVLITVAQTASVSVVVTCAEKGQAVAVPGFTGAISCPDPFVVCNLGSCTPGCDDTAMCINGRCVSATTITPVSSTPPATTTCVPASTSMPVGGPVPASDPTSDFTPTPVTTLTSGSSSDNPTLPITLDPPTTNGTTSPPGDTLQTGGAPRTSAPRLLGLLSVLGAIHYGL
ncbi:hypothetical protein SPRG_08672 [Saprolegnia parasitica CBS 223.65]|uniref:Leishmanolysin-like peptidase n=1 Tax=Saprolegnia parasitica (strain CBS 223.65) TaxID=695850 RepID=A0A067C5G6_SAPPC|nr:hypothetical protein SPRG_08672 [Saprolegnia parasitica CBS 223.65]KDO26019.1 hypothetical protein SPRG_08672 [Saprolegnia parasitica CBS 223.65]|eukprot:XP_012203305.1 hypothetical protein SPRG_08672 [Saprolegnia parasitica CBS 223.65]